MANAKHYNANNLFEAFRLSEQLKSVVRYKNAADDIEKESVAEHSWRVAFMVMVVCEDLNLQLDVLKAIKIAMVHDLVEAITDDIDSVLVRQGIVSGADKQNGEIAAILKIEADLGVNLGKMVRSLWEEFEFKKSKEAILVLALDKIEAMSHMTLVGLKNCNHAYDIPNYANSVVEEIPELRGLLKSVKIELKKEFIKNNIPWDI
jgi:putative hydrolase of HD superfamily